jgi:hypothetical protein
MRTKTLLCLAALTAGTIASWAQSNVYSLNVVGYYNLPLQANKFALIANQMNTTNNTIGSVLANVQDGTGFQKYAGGFTAYVYDGLSAAWTPNGNATLNPGEGGFIKSPVATTITFVGEELQGSLSLTMPKGQFAIRSSMTARSGTPTALNFPAEDGDGLQTYSGGYTAYVYDGLGAAWTPSEPTFSVGQSFFVKKAGTSSSLTWTQNFTVQ